MMQHKKRGFSTEKPGKIQS